MHVLTRLVSIYTTVALAACATEPAPLALETAERDCTIAVCGDGIVSDGEVCDDGNATNWDGCNADCTPSAADYIKSSTTGPSHQLGSSVALSANGMTLAAAAFGEEAVYVFVRSGATWKQQARLAAPVGGTFFGWSIALSANGTTLAVGAIADASGATGIGGDETDHSAEASGAVHVFTRSGAAWSRQAYVKTSITYAGTQLGSSVALSADGSTLAAGAYGAAAVFMFTRTETTWTEQATITPTIGGSYVFGLSVALSGNGSLLAVGDPLLESNAGVVDLFRRVGTTWTQQANLHASNPDRDDLFGWSVALSADGSTLAVGAHHEGSAATGINGNQADNSAEGAGAVYVFARQLGAWQQQAYVKATDAGWSESFGASVALSRDGSTLAVGAPNKSGLVSRSGGAYAFTRSGTTWSQHAYVAPSSFGGWFGTSVALSADGATLATGAPAESSAATGMGGDQTDRSTPSAGAIYVVR